MPPTNLDGASRRRLAAFVRSIHDSSHASVQSAALLPPGFRAGYPFSGAYDLWLPLIPEGSLSGNRRSHLLGVPGRLKPGIPQARARTELATIAGRIESQNPGVDPELNLGAVRLQERIVASFRPALLVFPGAVGLLLLIACMNVASLTVPHGTVRERELAVHAALGTGRLRLLRRLLTEGVLLAILGEGLGVSFAAFGVRVV
jgi:putative ABC transport system permease protein